MPKKPYHHGNLEETLIEAGLEILDKEGMSGFSLRKVAQACEVSHAAPYKHFSDKDALLAAMSRHVGERFGAVLEATWQEHRNDTRRMLFFAQAYLRFFLEKPHYFRFMITHSNDLVDLTHLDAPSEYYPFEIFRKAASEELEKCNVPGPQRHQTIISMWGMVHGITSIATMQGVQFDGRWDELLASILLNTKVGGESPNE